MEIISQTELMVIDDTNTSYLLFCTIVTYIIVAITLFDKPVEIKRILLILPTILGLLLVLSLAHTDSMYHPIGKYIYEAQYVNNAPELDTSKYTHIGEEVPSMLTMEFRDILTEEEEEALRKTEIFVSRVGFYRLICAPIFIMWFLVLWALTSPD